MLSKFVLCHILGGQLSFSLVVVDPVVGDSRQLPAAIVFIVDVVCDVLQVLHVSPEDVRKYLNC